MGGKTPYTQGQGAFWDKIPDAWRRAKRAVGVSQKSCPRTPPVPVCRNITWYNPPFDMRVKSNLGKKFLRIVCECFRRGHTLRPIFNRNTLKLSYSCMPNVKSTIDAHNKHLLKQTNSCEAISDANLCNCRKKEDCPLENQCLTSHRNNRTGE